MLSNSFSPIKVHLQNTLYQSPNVYSKSTLRLISTWQVTLLMSRMGRLMTNWLRYLSQNLIWITTCLFHVKEHRILFIAVSCSSQQRNIILQMLNADEVPDDWLQSHVRRIAGWVYFIWNLWPAIANRQAQCTLLLTQDMLNPNGSKIRFLVGEWCVHRTLCHPLPPCLEISQLIHLLCLIFSTIFLLRPPHTAARVVLFWNQTL